MSQPQGSNAAGRIRLSEKSYDLIVARKQNKEARKAR
jgi:hypothetical protein